MAVKLENEFLYVEIAEMGAEVTRIYDKTEDNEILWEGNPVYWKRHSPVLFPNVGKTYKNRVLINGTQYPTSQHGFARDNVFTCIESANEKASFMFRSSEETKEVYPFDFELHINYKLNKKELTVEWQVKNCGDETMYFTIGGHPAFICDDRQSMAGCEVVFGTKKPALSYKLLNEDGLVENEAHEMKLDESKVTVTEDFFDKDAYIFENSGCREVSIQADGKAAVTVTFDAPVFGLWSPVGKKVPFICIEPWYGRADAADFDGNLQKRAWQNELEPGKIFEKAYTIAF